MINRLGILILILFFYLTPVKAQWQQTFGPFGWTAMEIAAGNGYVYSSGGKVFRSSDNGMTWEEKGNGIWQWDIYELFVSGGRVFAVTAENDIGFLYVSDDNGESWMQHNSTGNTSLITGFTKIGSNLFAATYRNGVFVSADNGDTWTQTTGFGSPYIDISGIASLGSYLFVSAYGGLYRSGDNGSSWQFCPNPHFTIDGISAFTVHNGTLIMQYGSSYHWMYKSTDNGNSFVDMGNLLPYVFSFLSDGAYVYANTENGIFRSANDGISWERIALEGETTYSAAVSNGNIIVGTRDLGIFTSTNGGTAWINTGYRNNLSPQAIASMNSVLMVGNDGQTGVLISRDNGSTFSEYNSLNLSYVKSFAKRGTDIFAGTTPYIPQRGGVFKSTDSGLTWSFIGLPNRDIYSVAFSGNYLYAGSFYDGVFRTSNDGAMWAQVSVGLNTTWVKTLIVYNNILWAGTFTGLYSSTNNGNNWTLTAFQNASVNSLAIAGTKLFAGTETGVYVLEQSGSWTQTGLTDNAINCLTVRGTDLIAGGYPGLSISKDYGITWTSIKNNLPEGAILSLDYNDTYLFAGTSDNGIWKRPMAEITDVSFDETELPKEFALYQNYPNPFNPSTKIKYSVPADSKVTLKIFDLLGTEVATIIDEVKAPGSYEAEFNASDLSSGVYFYRLVCGKFSSVKKFVLIK